MKITPVAGAGAVQDKSTPDLVRTAKAVAAFNKGQSSYDKPVETAPTQGNAQETPVQDPNNISAEELSAVQTPKPTETIDNSTSTEETPKPTEETKPTKDPAVERQFAEIARQERILRAKANKQQLELKTREDALKAREDAINARSREYDQGYISKDKLKADTLAALAEANVSYDEVTQQLINQQPSNPRVDAHIARLEAKIAQLVEANETSQKTQQEAQQASYKAALRQIERDASALVKADPTTYEAIAKTGSIRDVVELIEQTYQKDGIVLDVEEAANEVENYLVEEGISTISKIEKIKRRLAQTATSTPASKQAQQTPAGTQKPQSTMKTLTNAASSSRKLSAKERAIMRANGYKGDFSS